MAKTKTKSKTLAVKNDKIVLKITPETVLKDSGFFDAVLMLCAIFNRKPRRPCVRGAVIHNLQQTMIMLLAQDGDLADCLKLLDKDAIEDGLAASTVSQLVKPGKRKKAVARSR